MTLTIIVILAVAVVLLIAALAILMGLFWRKNRELKQKNDAIIREMYRSQNIIERAVKHGVSRAALLSLLFGVCIVGKAQEEYFDYEDTDDDDKTIITGLTEEGCAATALTIPSSVTIVRGEAFSSSQATEICIDDANVLFETGAFSGITNKLVKIDAGSKMTAANIKTMLTVLGSESTSFSELYIGGYTEAPEDDIQWDDEDINSILTQSVHITMPATIVADQTFGKSPVYGRFSIDHAVSTICVRQTFEDTDNGSNMLFYVPTGIQTQDEEKMLHVQRVNYIKAEEGVLIHNALNTSSYADLPRYSGSFTSDDNDRYSKNMLKGVLEPTTLTATEGEGNEEKTNMILYNGLFYKISGGTLGANRAYLQVPTNELPSSGKLAILVDEDEEVTGINVPDSQSATPDGALPMYNLAGQRVAENYKGIVITNGKKMVKK